MSKKKWICRVCDEEYETKKELVECLEADLEEARMDLDIAMDQLEELGVLK